MKKNSKNYCIYCGMENEVKAKKCKKCDKPLNGKPHEVREFFKTKVKEKYLDEVEDHFWSIFQNFIKSHLYGTVVSLSVIFTATSLVVTNVSSNYIEKVTSKPEAANVRYEYAGAGLSAQELCSAYLEAIRLEDVATVEGLQLENFYPEIYQECVDYYQETLERNMPLTCIHHDLVANERIYTSHANLEYDPYYFLADSIDGYNTRIKTGGIYEKYPFTSYFFTNFSYLSDNEIYEGARGFVEIIDEIEVVEIDGNYYIVGEAPIWTHMRLKVLAERVYYMRQCNGDLTALEPYMNIYRNYLTDEAIAHALDDSFSGYWSEHGIDLFYDTWTNLTENK